MNYAVAFQSIAPELNLKWLVYSYIQDPKNGTGILCFFNKLLQAKEYLGHLCAVKELILCFLPLYSKGYIYLVISTLQLVLHQ